MTDAVVDAERRRIVGRCLRGDLGVGEGQRVLLRRVQCRDALVVVAPFRAAGAFGCDLPVGGVHVCACLEDRVGRFCVGWGDVVAADYVSCLRWEGMLAKKRRLLGKPGADHDIVAALPCDGQRVICHGTTPSESGPAHCNRSRNLDNRIISTSCRCRVGNADTV